MFVILLLTASTMLSIIPISGPAFPWSEAGAGRWNDSETYSGHWGLKAAQLCRIGNKCETLFYASQGDARIAMPSVYLAGRIVHALMIAVCSMDLAAFFSLMLHRKITSPFGFAFNSAIRFVSLLGGTIVWSCAAALWFLICHPIIRKVDPVAKLSGYFQSLHLELIN